MLSLLLMFAAEAQSSPQAETPMTVERAMRCASALRETEGDAEKVDFSIALRSVYFVMIAAREAAGQQSFFKRTTALMTKLSDYPVPTESAGEIISSCMKAEPRAGGYAFGVLPTDPAERDMMCAGTVALLEGLAIGYRNQSQDGAPAARWASVLATFQGRVERAAGSSGKSGDTMAKLEQKAELATRIGSPETIGKMCEAALR